MSRKPGMRPGGGGGGGGGGEEERAGKMEGGRKVVK
jgi:hypothetical protein